MLTVENKEKKMGGRCNNREIEKSLCSRSQM